MGIRGLDVAAAAIGDDGTIMLAGPAHRPSMRSGAERPSAGLCEGQSR